MAIEKPGIEIHEGRIARHKKRDKGRTPLDNAAIGRMERASALARKNAELGYDLATRIKGDRSYMGSRAAVSFPQNADELFKASNKAVTEAMTAGLAEISRLSKAIAPPEPLDKALAAQIRERFAKGSPDERAEWIKNENVASAVLTVPSFVSDVKEAEAELYLRQRAERLHPEETEALNAVRKSLHDLKDIGDVTEKYFGGLVRAMATPHAETAARTKSAQDAVAAAVAE